MEFKKFISEVVEGRSLSEDKAYNAMKLIMQGKASGEQIAGFLVALRMKGESIEEIAGFARAMHEFCVKIKPSVNGALLDTCGTGGDKIKTFNISTTAAFVVSGAGIYVAKHGNRSVTSKAGSADVLEALGVNIAMSPEKVRECIEQIGIGFMFAPLFHPAMKHAVKPRKELGIRTVFNVLGPLTNPAGARFQLLGIFSIDFAEKIAGALSMLGIERALVVHGEHGLDEISNLGKTFVAEVEKNSVEEYEIEPEEFGISRGKVKNILGGDAAYNAEICRKILENREKGDRLNIVLLNAGAAIYAAKKAGSIKEGIEIAKNVIEEGKALEKLKNLIEKSHG